MGENKAVRKNIRAVLFLFNISKTNNLDFELTDHFYSSHFS